MGKVSSKASLPLVFTHTRRLWTDQMSSLSPKAHFPRACVSSVYLSEKETASRRVNVVTKCRNRGAQEEELVLLLVAPSPPLASSSRRNKVGPRLRNHRPRTTENGLIPARAVITSGGAVFRLEGSEVKWRGFQFLTPDGRG